MHLKEACGMTINVDPDQTEKQSGLCQHYLIRPSCNYNFHGQLCIRSDFSNYIYFTVIPSNPTKHSFTNAGLGAISFLQSRVKLVIVTTTSTKTRNL